MILVDLGRRRHYGTFYGLNPLPDDGRPVLVVHGNCQAEALRVLLTGPWPGVDGGSAAGSCATVRIPPVHELEADDVPFLAALLARTDVLLSQPVRDGYRQLPLGTAELAALVRPGATALRYPIVRYLGLHPYQGIVRHPSAPAAVPAGVPYHDLRILAAVRDALPPAAAIEAAQTVSAPADVLRAVGAQSLRELARREAACDVAVSDLLEGFGPAAAHTINHPGNPVLLALAHRLQRELGLAADAADPGRVLLGGVRAPLEAAVLAARGLPGPGSEHWLVDAVPVPVAQVVSAQLAWYAAHPQFVPAGLERHAERISLLGLDAARS
jgi:hypothetical protein